MEVLGLRKGQVMFAWYNSGLVFGLEKYYGGKHDHLYSREHNRCPVL